MVNKGKLLPSKAVALPRNKIVDIIQHLEEPYNIIFAIQYLTASRIGEVLMLKKNDFEYKKVDNSTLLLITLRVLKRRNNLIYKAVPVNLNDELTGMIINYVEKQLPDVLLFKGITKNLAWFKLTRKYPQIRTHTFRRSRITELFKEHNWSETEITRFVGWASPASTATYIHLKWRDSAQKVLDLEKTT